MEDPCIAATASVDYKMFFIHKKMILNRVAEQVWSWASALSNFILQSSAAVVASMVRFWQAGRRTGRPETGTWQFGAEDFPSQCTPQSPPPHCTWLAGWARIVSSWVRKTESGSKMISWKRLLERVCTYTVASDCFDDRVHTGRRRARAGRGTRDRQQS